LCSITTSNDNMWSEKGEERREKREERKREERKREEKRKYRDFYELIDLPCCEGELEDGRA